MARAECQAMTALTWRTNTCVPPTFTYTWEYIQPEQARTPSKSRPCTEMLSSLKREPRKQTPHYREPPSIIQFAPVYIFFAEQFRTAWRLSMHE